VTFFMSRLEKARDEKQKGKKKTGVAVVIVFAVIIIAGLVMFVDTDLFTGLFDQGESDYIDLEQSRAFIDIFDLTYVRIYIDEGAEVEEVSADGNQLEFNDEDERWEITMSGYSSGDEVEVTVVEKNGEEILQETVLVVEEL